MQDQSNGHNRKNGNRPVTLDDLTEFFQGVIVPYMATEFGKVNDRLDGLDGQVGGVEGRLAKVEDRLSKLETELMHVKNDIRGLKADMPTKEEFEVVRKLERLHHRELAALA